jgi:hypothetical protein
MGVQPSESVDLKFFRHPPGDHSDYGPSIENCVRSILKDERAYSVLSKKARAKIPGTAIVVERHEDGPSILGVPLIDLATYISTLVTMAGLWFQLRDRRSKQPSHEVRVKVGSGEYRGPVRSARHLRQIVRALKEP